MKPLYTALKLANFQDLDVDPGVDPDVEISSAMAFRAFFEMAAGGKIDLFFVRAAILKTAIRLLAVDDDVLVNGSPALELHEPWTVDIPATTLGYTSPDDLAFGEIAELFLTGRGNYLKLTRKCPTCGSIFIGENSKATFCRDACRAKWHRNNKKNKE